MARGGKRKQFIVKEEVALTLDNLLKVKPEPNALKKLARNTTLAWKVLVLVSPRRVFKYNFRNLTGDADAGFAGNAAGFLKAPQAIKELYAVFYGDKSMTPDMRDWFEHGGMQTLLQAQELGDLNQLRLFKHLVSDNAQKQSPPMKAWKSYWKQARLATDFREAILRYANYLSYLEQMKNNGGVPKNFGASNREEVMALKTMEAKAFKLSNDLLGAYDQVGVIGQDLRENLIPFWSWTEVNFRRYKQLAKNAVIDDKLAGVVGRKLLTGVVVRSPLIALRVGKFAIKATMLLALLTAWNLLRFPDEEKDLPEDVRNKPHIIFGRDKNGNVRYFSRLGALADLLEWVNIDGGTPKQAKDWLNGELTLKQAAIEMAKSPINKLANSVTPLIKSPFEVLVGFQTFPDVFKPRAIRDKMDYLAQTLGVENEYRSLTGKPTKGYLKSGEEVFIYKAEPGRTAYSAILDLKYKYVEELGKGSFRGVYDSEKSNALYYFKMAIRYDDKEAADKYLLEYVLAGGTKKGLGQSLESLHPLSGLRDTADNGESTERDIFISKLSAEEKVTYEEALKYANDVLLGSTGKDIDASIERVQKMPRFKAFQEKDSE